MQDIEEDSSLIEQEPPGSHPQRLRGVWFFRYEKLVPPPLTPDSSPKNGFPAAVPPGPLADSAASALSTAVLLILVLLSFFTPPLLYHRPFLRNHAGEQQRDVIGSEPFIVPSGGGSPSSDLWGSEMARFYYGCSNANRGFEPVDYITHLDRYLMIATSGWLNQQRTGITDDVVAARILNATLIVSKLDQKSFCKDVSDFTEIFDVDWFISYLSKDVKFIKLLLNIGGKVVSTPYHMGVPRKCTV